ncbi:YfcE family phosphodiesterase [Candidatus Falkowbacteria bacterium]|jgi:uncharacterized protein|nr:YfcE family phosphodiesterase [Candidatus Falkowbacteria bacterium]MBT4432863.1 YfcE family phosphodiesterase [Candidatus Falkowbacteria bacterium]
MKFAIISDVHDNLANLEKALNYINKNKIKTLICCGDLVLYDTFSFLIENFKGDLYYVFGNNEEWHEEDGKKIKNSENKTIQIFDKIGEFKIDKLKIAITHYPWIAKNLAKSEKFNLVFFGHSHKPTIETINKTILLNPGTTGGVFFQPSFAIFDTNLKKPELILLNEL